jgi:saccharopine dehydrogenase-like NADP-dependent oxidoreductase
MAEKTLRWPGHVEAVKPLVAAGKLLEEFHARCEFAPPEDHVVLLVRVRRGDRVEEAQLVDRYDPATGLTAMARTTALTTSAVAQWVASGAPIARGVRPLERVAAEPGAYDAIRASLERRGVRLSWRETAGTR